MFSVHMHGSPDDPLMSAFIQVGPSSASVIFQHKKAMLNGFITAMSH